MKKIILLLAALNVAAFANAQDDLSRAQDDFHADKTQDTTMCCHGRCCCKSDAELAPWVLDVNLMGGGVGQTLSNVDMNNTYSNAVNNNISGLKYTKGSSAGFEAEVGYFFGKSRHFGVGTGIMLMEQYGTMSISQFHTEYESTDYQGETFRQVLTANGGISEKLTTTNVNIPLVFKYKTQLGRGWGFAADAGALINLSMHNGYTSNTNFNYEAIYSFNGENLPVYDASPTPNPNDWIITKSYVQAHNPAQNVNTYFQQKAAQGYNVGLGVTPNSTTGHINYNSGSIGLILQPSVTYQFCDKLALNMGVFYVYQTFSNSANNNYEVTNKVGSYSSVMNSVKTADNSIYGINVGIRFFFGMLPDRDHDGTPDKRDRCPDEAGPKKFHGCPDRDGDGIPDIDDECPDQPGLAKFNGCPDTDGDGIPDNIDECPTIPGLPQFNGCPDSDNDGIPDKDDSCPHTPGLAQFHGCPDIDGDGTPDYKDQCPTVPGPIENHGCPYPPKKEVKDEDVDREVIRFETGKAVIKKSTYGYLNEMIKALKDDPNADVEIDGHTDITGGDQINNKLSNERAQSVKDYLMKHGIAAKRIKTKWYGSKHPVASNKTTTGRAKNRRAVLKLMYSNKYSDND